MHSRPRGAPAYGPLTRVCSSSSSGGEAIESALKLARATTKRKPLLYCNGRLLRHWLGALSVMGSSWMRESRSSRSSRSAGNSVRRSTGVEQRSRESGVRPRSSSGQIQAGGGRSCSRKAVIQPRSKEALQGEGHAPRPRRGADRIGRTRKDVPRAVEDFVPDILVPERRWAREWCRSPPR